MKKYEVEVQEVLSRVVEVEAKNESEAIEKVKEMYKDEDIVLDYEDFFDYEINILREGE